MLQPPAPNLSDIADTALRRMGRELHAALPNSVRVSGNYIEFLPTTMGGRYRKERDCTAVCTGDALSFTAADISFDVIGSLPRAPAIGEEIVIYNTAPFYVYAGNNVAAIAADSTAGKILFSSLAVSARVSRQTLPDYRQARYLCLQRHNAVAL